uniref:Uncharacterized LOC100183915 n=1 Tax=Ciona intestinalis TaxID=7719 RepID=F6ZFU1_CIOIN|nr:uncharacterized protein LOC100183915 [Ciona intestinalis]|eukprot:XP_009859254.1 uncharacterized protein LOC100183915 [Ciona intestinalis]
MSYTFNNCVVNFSAKGPENVPLPGSSKKDAKRGPKRTNFKRGRPTETSKLLKKRGLKGWLKTKVKEEVQNKETEDEVERMHMIKKEEEMIKIKQKIPEEEEEEFTVLSVDGIEYPNCQKSK